MPSGTDPQLLSIAPLRRPRQQPVRGASARTPPGTPDRQRSVSRGTGRSRRRTCRDVFAAHVPEVTARGEGARPHPTMEAPWLPRPRRIFRRSSASAWSSLPTRPSCARRCTRRRSRHLPGDAPAHGSTPAAGRARGAPHAAAAGMSGHGGLHRAPCEWTAGRGSGDDGGAHRVVHSVRFTRWGAWFTIVDLGALVRRHRADDSIARALSKIVRSD